MCQDAHVLSVVLPSVYGFGSAVQCLSHVLRGVLLDNTWKGRSYDKHHPCLQTQTPPVVHGQPLSATAAQVREGNLGFCVLGP